MFNYTFSMVFRWIIFFVLNAAVHRSSALRLTKMAAPRIIDFNEQMDLECHFDMGNEQLYAVKWYKDDHEFFRYMPEVSAFPDSVLTFPVSGVHVEKNATGCDQSQCYLRLSKLLRNESSGAYRCEVSSEAPAFRLASETHNVTVAVLPIGKPTIDVPDDNYYIGDIFTAKCTSPPSDPPQHLRWYINKAQVPDKLLRDSRALTPKEQGLYTRFLQLRFTIEKSHITRENSMELTCVSLFPGIPETALSISRTIYLANPKSPGIVGIKNQMYSWNSSSICITSNLDLLLVISVVRWHITSLIQH